MTANPTWREIKDELNPGQTYADRPDLVARVFKLKKRLCFSASKMMEILEIMLQMSGLWNFRREVCPMYISFYS
jgi:hypothetical protein